MKQQRSFVAKLVAEKDASDDESSSSSSSSSEGEQRVPPGAVKSLWNKMQYVFYELTGDKSDPRINKPEKFILPSSLGDVANFKEASAKTSKTGLKNAIAFSHLTSSRSHFENIECTFSPNEHIHPIVDGIVMDRRSAEEAKDGDLYLDVNDDGNLMAIHVMPTGWVEAYHSNLVCNVCGKFPSYGRCFSCNCGSFCSDECRIKAARTGEHTKQTCMRMSMMRVKLANPIMVKPDKEAKAEEEEDEEEEEEEEEDFANVKPKVQRPMMEVDEYDDLVAIGIESSEDGERAPAAPPPSEATLDEEDDA